MRKSRIFIGFVLILMLTLLLSACAKEDKSSNFSTEDRDMSSGESTGMDAPEVAPAEEPAATDSQSNSESGLANSSNVYSEVPDANELDKIIRRVNMDVETQEFDDLINKIDQQIKRLGGYVESSEISGRRFNYNDENRSGYIVARVPKEHLDEFVNKMYESANVFNKNVSTENITLKYNDAENRKKSLEIEQERLLVLLAKTETLEDILVLESRLSDVRYELQNYQTQLRTYDNLVEYSTVTLNISEVDRITPVTEEKRSVWDRIRIGFGDTMYDIGEGLQNFLVWFIVNLPYLIVWAVIITAGILIGRKIYYKKYPKNPKNPKNPKSNSPSEEDKKQ